MLTRIINARPRSQISFSGLTGLRVAALLIAIAMLASLGTDIRAQVRPATLTPSRDSAAPGATLSIAISPALATQQPAGSHLVLRSTRRGPDVELRIVEWRGNGIRAQIPRDAGVDAGATRLMLLDRRNEVIAHSGNQMFRVAAAGELPSAGRIAGAEGSRTSEPGSGPISRVPGSQVPDVAGRREAPDRSAGAVVPNVPNLLPPDPRTERGVHARPGVPSTPGVRGQAREPDIASDGAGDRRRPPFLRDQDLPDMNYRRFGVRSVAECHTACSVESQCRSWTFRPAQPNNTFDNRDDGPTCFLKSGIPQRVYARGYVSGLKPPPPAVAAGAPPPPVVSR
jgi:PAN domain